MSRSGQYELATLAGGILELPIEFIGNGGGAGSPTLQASCILDTGASKSLLSPRLVEQLKRLGAGRLKAGPKQLIEVTVGDDTTHEEETSSWDVMFHFGDDAPRTARLLEWSKLGPDVVLGTDFLTEQGVEIKFSKDGPATVSLSDTLEIELVHLLTLEACEAEDCERQPEQDLPGDGGGVKLADVGRMPEEVRVELKDGMAKVKALSELESTPRQQKLNTLAAPFVEELRVRYADSVFGEPRYGKDAIQPTVNGEPYFFDIEVLPGSEPRVDRAIRQGLVTDKAMAKIVREMVDKGAAYPCSSPWGAAAFLRKKKEAGEYRLVANYKPINACTKAVTTEMPTVQECIEAQAVATIRTSLDLKSAFTRIPCTKRAAEGSAIITACGQYCMSQMPQGLMNAPAALHQVVTGNFRDEIWGSEKDGKPEEAFVQVYFDDMIIFSRGDPMEKSTVEEHFDKVGRVLAKLESLGFTLALKKARWYQEFVPYLGFILGPKGDVMVDRAKVQEVLEMPMPSTKKQLRSFLGKLQYQRAFIPEMSRLCAPLTDLVGDDCDFRFAGNKEVVKAWWDLKLALVQAPVLHLTSGKGPYYMYTDASDTHIGGSLFEARPTAEDSERRVLVGFFSRKLSKAQKNYSTTYKEQLAVMQGLNHWEKLFRYADKTKLYVDNSSIVHLRTKPLIAEGTREHRILEVLNGFDCEILHIPGEENTFADAYSRPPGSESNTYRILDLCAGSATLLLALEELARTGELLAARAIWYTPVDHNSNARKLIKATYNRMYEENRNLFARGPSDELFSLGHQIDENHFVSKLNGKKFDQIFGGLDCRDFSSARRDKNGNPNAPGLDGQKELFTAAHLIVEKLLAENPNVHFCFECTPFGMEEYTPHLKDHWKEVENKFKEFPNFQYCVKNLGDHFLPQKRVRLFMYNFNVTRPWPKCGKSFQEFVGDEGTVPEGLEQAYTIMASTRTEIRKRKLNWITSTVNGEEVTRDLGFNIEERLQGLPEDHTKINGIKDVDRTSLIGNALMTPAVTFLLREAMRPANILDLEDERVLELEENHIGLNVLRASETDMKHLREKIRDQCHSDEQYRAMYAKIEDGGDDEGFKIANRNSDGEKGIIMDKEDRWVLPASEEKEMAALKQEILSIFHDETHHGHTRDYDYMKHFVTWPGMRDHLKMYIDSCRICKEAKGYTRGLKGKLRPLPIAESPGRRINMDFLAMPVCTASWGGVKRSYRGIFAVIDAFSRYCVLIPYAGTVLAETVAEMYTAHALPVFGFVDTIVSDRDPRFSSRVWTEMIKRHGIQATKTTAYRPCTDGAVERMFRELLTKLRVEITKRSGVDGQTANWPELLPWAELVLNTTRHTSTKETPWFLQHGRQFRKPLELLFRSEDDATDGIETYADRMERNMREAVERAKAAQEGARKAMADRRPDNPSQEAIKEGDLVYVKGFHRGVEDKLKARQSGPYRVEKKIDEQVYKIKRDSPRQQHTLNADRLIKLKDVEEMRELFPKPRWSPPDAGFADSILGPHLIKEINFSSVPPRYLVQRTDQAPLVWHEEDELTALYATAEEAPGALRELIREYLERHNVNRLTETEVPDKDEDPEGYRKCQDHLLLLYDRRPDAIGPQYYRRSSAQGPGAWVLTPECVQRIRILKGERGATFVDEQEDEMVVAPLDTLRPNWRGTEDETERDDPQPPENVELTDKLRERIRRLGPTGGTPPNLPENPPEDDAEFIKKLEEGQRKRNKEANRRKRARRRADKAEGNYSWRERNLLFKRFLRDEPLSSSDEEAEDDPNDGENFSSPPLGGDTDDGGGDANAEVENPEASEDPEEITPEDNAEDDVLDEDADDLPEDEVESESSADEEEVVPRRSARIAARATTLLLLNLLDSLTGKNE